MNFSWLDWSIVACFFLALTFLAFLTKKFTLSVADFLVANRCAGRYLLTVAAGTASMGAITFVGAWEMYYQTGFCVRWWSIMLTPVAAIIAATGYATYRFRQTRAMTLAQFFEMRYSRNFRVFAGIMGFVSGILNFGIFPGITAYLFIYFCGLPLSFTVFGLSIPTFPLVMLFILIAALAQTWIGGQIAIIVTDFLQGMFLYVVFAVILIYLFFTMNWSDVSTVLATGSPKSSMLNPLHTNQISNFNIWFVLINIFACFYAPLGWQGGQAMGCSAKNAHEGKMAGIIGTWKGLMIQVFLVVPGIIALVVFSHGDYSSLAYRVKELTGGIENSYIQKQMTVPVMMSQILPVGLRGALCAALLATAISNFNSYMHSWGSIFVQDVIMPLRRKPIKPEQHILLLRLSITGVVVFIFCFSLFFELKEAVFMFTAITGAIFVGGAGAAIIGGLYWKKGTAAGAWGAMITGAVLALAGVVVRQIWPKFFGIEFPINSQWVFGISMWCSIAAYVIFSLLENKVFNMDRMLHRGQYAVKEISENPVQDLAACQDELDAGPIRRFLLSMGLSKEFTRGDRIALAASLLWSLGWFLIFVIGTVYNSVFEVSDNSWLKFWKFEIAIFFGVGIVTAAWLTLGGLRDITFMFKALGSVARNEKDNGTVISDHGQSDKMGKDVEIETGVRAK